MEISQPIVSSVATTNRLCRTMWNALATAPITMVTTTLETKSVDDVTRNANSAMVQQSTSVRCAYMSESTPVYRTTFRTMIWEKRRLTRHVFEL